MADNAFQKFFKDLGRRLGLWDDRGKPIPSPTRPGFMSEPPSPSGGGFTSGFDDEIRWIEADKYSPAHYEVGSEGNPPSIDGIRDMFDKQNTEDDFYTIIIGGDYVEGDTGSLGPVHRTVVNPDGSKETKNYPMYRGYKMQKDDVQQYLKDSRDVQDFANKVAPQGRKWHGVHLIRLADY